MLLAIDQGTTSTKALTYENGIVRAIGSRTHRQHRPRPGWVEHEPLEILAHVRELLEAAGPVAAVGLANQGEAVVAWDAATKRPLGRALVWQDTRTTPDVERLRADGAEELTLERAGLPLDPYFAASRLRWLLDHADGAAALRASGRLRLGTSDAFLLDALTGRATTDPSTASRTSLMDLRTLEWDPDLCAVFGVPMECLPAIGPTAGDLGGLHGAPLEASAVDQQAALFGHGCHSPGDVKVTFGTGAFALCVTGEQPPAATRSGCVPTVAWRFDGHAPTFAAEGGVLTAGAALDWAVGLGLPRDVAPAPASEVGRGPCFVPALAGLGSPHRDRQARGGWVGLTLDTGPEAMTRAVLEGVALRSAEVVASLAELAGTAARRVAVDGGLTRSRHFVEVLSAALGRPVEVSRHADVTAIGLLAMMAGVRGLEAPVRRYDEASAAAPIGEDARERFAAAVAAVRSLG